jgi:Holliday junction resolvasome RuvABC endonuclease subunit
MSKKQLNPKLFGHMLKKGSNVAIGIDQSLTGFAMSAVSVSDPEKHLTSVYKSPYSGVQRLSDIQQNMYNFFKLLSDEECVIVDIAMEGTVLASQSALVLGELSATVKMFLYDHFNDINNYFPAPPQHLRTPLIIPPMTLKKYATGKGTSKKQEMLMQIYKRWNVEFNDDNAADAYALARLAGKLQIDAIEKQVVEQVEDPKYRDMIQPTL